MKVWELTTPCFVVDINKLKNNAAKMRKNCEDLGVILRPHAKTHKTVEAAVIQTNGTKRCVVVSTLPEAEKFAAAGFDDILLAHPITQDKIKRCIALMEKLDKFIVMVSDDNGLKCLHKNQDLLPPGKRWSVIIEVDTGYKRTGFVCNSDEMVNAVGAVLQSMNFIGIYCHCGSAYNINSAKDREDHHKEVTSSLTNAKKRIQSAYPNAPNFIAGTGSTPSCSLFSECHKDLDEFHPGNYIFYDMEQYLLNACRQSDIAGRVMTKVMAHKPEENMILVDCGFLGVSLHGMDKLPENFCEFDGETNLKMVSMSQEVGKVKAKTGELDCRLYPVGTILFILPYHSCATAAMHQIYHIHDGDEVVSTWTPVKGW